MFTDPLNEFIKDMNKFQQMVEQTIDLDSAEKGDFLVRSEFDDELKGTYKMNIYYIYIMDIICINFFLHYILYLLIISINIRIKMYYG